MGNVAIAGTMDATKAVAAFWKNSDLNATFRNYRTSDAAARVLFDTRATPTTPLPYCIFEQSEGGVVEKTSGDQSDERFHLLEMSFQLRVHAKTKDTASVLAKAVMELFASPSLEFTDGKFVNLLHEADWGVRDGDNGQWLWAIRYSLVFESRIFIGTN